MSTEVTYEIHAINGRDRFRFIHEFLQYPTPDEIREAGRILNSLDDHQDSLIVTVELKRTDVSVYDHMANKI